MICLSLDKISKVFGGVTAVADLTLEIPRGQITGLIGPNGAGKTTVVNLITGMLKATSGRITLNGKDVTQYPAHEVARAGVARTFQNIRLLRAENVLDNVMIGFHRHETTSLWANLFGLPSARRERTKLRKSAAELLDQFGLAEFARFPAGQLSYGHQRRVEMVRALATRPDLLLLDEPVAGMNDREAAELGAIFSDIAASGLSILLIEHNMRFVMSLCQYIYVVNSGRMICSGSPNMVAKDPAVIEAYLGSE